MQNELVTDRPALLLRRLDDVADRLPPAGPIQSSRGGPLNPGLVVRLSSR